jgi:hypothetical protein
VVVEPVLADLATERVAVNAEHFGRAALVAIGAFQGAFDKALFKFAYGFIKKNSAIYHLADKSF